MLHNLLLYRFALFNGGMAALFGYLSLKGYVAAAVVGDFTGLSLLIAALFALLMGSTVQRVWKTSKAMNQLKDGNAPLGKPWTKRLIKIKHIKDGANWLAYLGLLGTVIGFIISLSGIDVGTLALVQGVQAMIPSLMAGMKVALYTTLAGGFFSIWTEVNYRMLETATVCLVEDEKKAWGDGG